MRKVWIWTIVISSIVLLSAILFALLTAAFQNSAPQPASTSSGPTLTMSGKAIPGQTVQVVGDNFTTGQTVLVTLDGQPLPNKGATTYTWPASGMSLSLVNRSSTNSGGTSVNVQAYGKFTVDVHIPANWSVGSTHHVKVTDEQEEELKSMDFTIDADQSSPTPTPTSTPTSVPIPESPSAPLPTPTPTPGSAPTPTPKPKPRPTPTPILRLTPRPIGG